MEDQELEKDQDDMAQEAAAPEEGQTAEREEEAQAEAPEAEPQADEEAAKESKKEAKKKKKKDKKEEQIEELTDRLKRSMAEFDNYRKRVEKEKSHMYEVGAKDVIEKILPVVDNFQRGFDSLSEEEKEAPFAAGMDKVFKQLQGVLEEIGVKPIEALNQEFDPNLHNAVMHVEDESLGENVIVEEFQKGYCYKDSVVRHSMVKVAN
jgi:molecular chaperone GrpE